MNFSDLPPATKSRYYRINIAAHIFLLVGRMLGFKLLSFKTSIGYFEGKVEEGSTTT